MPIPYPTISTRRKQGNADWQFNILAGVSIRFGKGYTRKTQKAAPTSIPPRNVPKEEPKEDPKPVVVPEKKTEKLQPIQVNVFFKINSAVIRPEEAGKVDELAAYLQKNPAAQVTLTGMPMCRPAITVSTRRFPPDVHRP